MTATFEARAVARSHVGAVRTMNEDRVFNSAEHCLWAIADGMGGHAGGDVAAEIVVNALGQLVDSGTLVSEQSVGQALTAANSRVLERRQGHGGQSGSTVAGLLLDRGDAIIFWVGDSRVYRARAGRLDLLTHDHRFVQGLLDAGTISPQQAREHPRAAVITRAIGAAPRLEIAWRVEPATAGDIYLLCSDGLTDLIDPEEIARFVVAEPQAAADGLIDQALAQGGTDNVSVVIVSLAAVSQARDHASARMAECETRF